MRRRYERLARHVCTVLVREGHKGRLQEERGLREESGVGVSDPGFVGGKLETPLQPTQLVCPGNRLTITVRRRSQHLLTHNDS